jgi:hypothetical protein
MIEVGQLLQPHLRLHEPDIMRRIERFPSRQPPGRSGNVHRCYRHDFGAAVGKLSAGALL